MLRLEAGTCTWTCRGWKQYAKLVNARLDWTYHQPWINDPPFQSHGNSFWVMGLQIEMLLDRFRENIWILTHKILIVHANSRKSFLNIGFHCGYVNNLTGNSILWYVGGTPADQVLCHLFFRRLGFCKLIQLKSLNFFFTNEV